MGVKERRQREKSETRDKILDAARELFLTEGYEGVSMRKVAEKIEYSPTAIYLHFADKQELFRELCQQQFARLAEGFQTAAMSADPLERIKQIGQTYIDFGARYPNHYRFMFMAEQPVDCEEEADQVIKGNPEVDAYAFLKMSVQQVIDGGYLRPELNDAELVSQTLWAAVHGVISLQIAKSTEPWVNWRPLQERAALMLDATLRGMLRSTLREANLSSIQEGR